MDSGADLVTGVWVLTVAMGGRYGWGGRYRLDEYPHLFLFLLSFALGPGAFLMMGLVLGWAGHGCNCCG